MNLQEIFDTVTNHLYKQGGQSIKDGLCQYLTADGSKCAVGCLIKPEFYSDEFEKRGITDFRVSEAVGKSLGTIPLASGTCSLLFSLQEIHDGFYPSKRETWEKYLDEYLANVAVNFNLNFNKA